MTEADLSIEPIDTGPQSGALAASALALALAGVVLPPLALIGLILGIIALAKGMAGKGMAIAAVAIAPLSAFTCLAAAVMLPALGQWRMERMRMTSAQQLRSIGQMLMIYAGDYDNWYPEAGADWEKRLIDRGMPPRLLVAPDTRPDQYSYYYIPGRRLAFDSRAIILYEDAALWRGQGGNVYYDDGRIDWVPGEEYAALFERLEQTRLGQQSERAPAAEAPARPQRGAPSPSPPSPPLPLAHPEDVVNIVSRGMELAEAPGHQALRARSTRSRPAIAVGPMETIIEWRLLLINQTDQQIESLILAVEGTARAQQVDAIPAHEPLMARAPLEVIVPVKLLPGAMPSSLHLSAKVVGVRFADGSTLGESGPARSPALPRGADPARDAADAGEAGDAAEARDPGDAGGSGGAPKPPPRDRDEPAAQISPFAEPLLVRRAEITVREATYGAGEARVDVTAAIEDWMAEGDWPRPLRIDPSQFKVPDPASGVAKTLLVRFEATGSAVTFEAADGDWLLVGGPGSLGLGPVAHGAPVELEGMRIVAAWYGHADRWVNVLPALRERVDEAGRIDTRASRGLAGMDPVERVHKSLLLYFERDGALWQASYPENAPVLLPLD